MVSYRNGSIPILMYHSVGREVQSRRDTFLNVSADGFRRQMQALVSLGFRARSCCEVINAIRNRRQLPKRTIVITFDDGFRCVREIAAPILESHGFPATVFVVPDWIADTEFRILDAGRMNLPLMDWQAIRELQAMNWEIGGHTLSHPHLDTMNADAALEQIREGKIAVEAQIRTSLQTFCYPFGHWNAHTPAAVQKAGFAGACTVMSGLAHIGCDPYVLPRVKVGYRDGVSGLLYRMLVRPSLPTFRRHRRSHPTHIPIYEELEAA